MTHPPYPGTPAAPDALPPPPQGQPAAVVSTHGLAVGAALTAIVVTVIEVVEVPLAWAAQDAYLDAADAGTSSLDVLTAYDFVGLPWVFAMIASFVVTCMWLYRVRTNVELTRREVHHARSKGWVWGGWIVPVVALWFPFQIVRDVTQPLRQALSIGLLGWWWAFWLLTTFSSQIGPQLTGFGEIDTSAVRILGLTEGVNAVLTIVALILWLVIIRRIDQQRAERP